jgi:hypothetical protein
MVKFDSLYTIPCIRGRFPVDPEIIADYLWETTQNPKNRKVQNSEDVRYQDFHIPNNVKEESPHTYECLNYMIGALKEATGCDDVESDWPWCIVNRKNEQIYPHHHLDGGNQWAAVYWAQVPEGSGDLEFYLTGRIMDETVFVAPEAGHFLIFPAYLTHGVRHNTSDKERMSMSFNMTEVYHKEPPNDPIEFNN